LSNPGVFLVYSCTTGPDVGIPLPGLGLNLFAGKPSYDFVTEEPTRGPYKNQRPITIWQTHRRTRSNLLFGEIVDCQLQQNCTLRPPPSSLDPNRQKSFQRTNSAASLPHRVAVPHQLLALPTALNQVPHRCFLICIPPQNERGLLITPQRTLSGIFHLFSAPPLQIGRFPPPLSSLASPYSVSHQRRQSH